MRFPGNGALGLLIAGVACQGEPAEDHRVAPDLRPGVVAVAEMGRTATCENDAAGVRVVYPAAWHTNSGEGLPHCSLFHPEPIGSVRSGEFEERSWIAIRIELDTVTFERATTVPQGEMWLARERAVVAGLEAERSEIIPGDGLMTRGDRTYRYHVDLDGATLVASTHEAGDVPFEQKRRVLDAMMLRIELLDRVQPTHASGDPTRSDPRD